MLPIEIENRRQEIEARIGSLGAWLVDLSFRKSSGRGVLTVIADKKGGITLDECAAISRSLSEFLDEQSCAPLDAGYYLEVNSPGLDRPLKTPADFSRAAGERVKVIVRESPTRTVEIVGEIFTVKEDSVTLKKGKDGVVAELPMAAIVRAVREIRF